FAYGHYTFRGQPGLHTQRRRGIINFVLRKVAESEEFTTNLSVWTATFRQGTRRDPVPACGTICFEFSMRCRHTFCLRLPRGKSLNSLEKVLDFSFSPN